MNLISGYTPSYVVLDSVFLLSEDYRMNTWYRIKTKKKGESGTQPRNMNWTQPIPPSTKASETAPSDQKRAKLRAKRKKRK